MGERKSILLVLTVTLLSIAGCGTGKSASDSAGSQCDLVGSWISGSNKITIRDDDTYSVDLNQDGIADVTGAASVNGNSISLTDSGGGSACKDGSGQFITGTYAYAVTGSTLKFTIINDSCSNRASLLSVIFTKTGGLASLEGTWIIDGPYGSAVANTTGTVLGPGVAPNNNTKMFFATDGAGKITSSDVKFFFSATSASNYTVQTNETSFSMTIKSSGDVYDTFHGTLLTATSGTVLSLSTTGATGNDTSGLAGTIHKVTNPAACQGIWSGTFLETTNHPNGVYPSYPISFTIDSEGTVTSFTGAPTSNDAVSIIYPYAIRGNLYCESGHVAALFVSTNGSFRSEFRIWGNVSGSTLTGYYEIPGGVWFGTVTLSRQ